MSSQTFQAALGQLIRDPSYRSAVESSPQRLLDDFAMERSEIGLLMQIWEKYTDDDVVGHMNIYCCCCCCAP